MTYGERSNGKQHGVVFTQPEVIHYMLDNVRYQESNDLRDVKILEPAAGDGAFIVEIITRLYYSSLKFNFDFKTAIHNVACYELEKCNVKALKARVQQLFSQWGLKQVEFEPIIGDFLEQTVSKQNVIIGNPPYVRHEQIPEDKKQLYRLAFKTFRHRSDLYIPFIEKSLQLLSPKGKLSFICSNRWLKNQYGSSLRKYITNNFSLEQLINTEKINAFGEQVLAYPSIFVIANNVRKHPTKVFALESREGQIKLNTASYRELVFQTEEWGTELFNHGKQARQLTKLTEMGFEIGIGVATGAEEIFIGTHLKNEVENELLLPIISAKNLRKNKLEWTGAHVLNPFQKSGALIDLDKYPKAKAYLESKSDHLKSRHISKKNLTHWYKTIDRIKPELIGKPKVLLPDITGNSKVIIDYGKFYPNHNIYYIVGNSIPDLKIIAALLMSEFILSQLRELGNLMNGGYPRWQSQNLRKLQFPNIFELNNSDRIELINAYEGSNIELINALVTRIVDDLPPKALSTEHQLALFPD